MTSYKAYSTEYKQVCEKQPAGDGRNSFGRCSSHGPPLKTWFNFRSYKTYRWDASFGFCESSCDFKYGTFYAQYICLEISLCLFVVLRMYLMNSGFYVFIHFTAFCALGDAKSLKWKACFKCFLIWLVTLHNYLKKFSVIEQNCEQNYTMTLKHYFCYLLI